MNEQRAPGGIEWTRIVRSDGTQMRGFTWNPTAGCHHGCTWRMPDGSLTECYAKTVAEGVARAAYPEGFEHHYWRPDALKEPERLKHPAGIFVGSMADLFGHWVPDPQICAVLDVADRAPQHIFQFLTKYPNRIADDRTDWNFPQNAWAGVSLPAGHRMSETGAARALQVYLRHMAKIEARVRFMSIEPLWFDVAPVLRRWRLFHGRLPFEWAIIGAASKGRAHYQPDAAHLQDALRELDKARVPVFMKGNLKATPWREEFPPC